MRTRRCLAVVILVMATLSHAQAGTTLLYDFEDGPQGWTADWGLTQELEAAKGRTRNGRQSLLVRHRFMPKAETIGLRVILDTPMNATEKDGFIGFTAWVYIPSGDEWQIQMYMHTGDAWKWSEGTLKNNLMPGWHQVSINAGQILDPSAVRDIGIQIKNFKLNYDAKIFIDRVEAVYANGQ